MGLLNIWCISTDLLLFFCCNYFAVFTQFYAVTDTATLKWIWKVIATWIYSTSHAVDLPNQQDKSTHRWNVWSTLHSGICGHLVCRTLSQIWRVLLIARCRHWLAGSVVLRLCEWHGSSMLISHRSFHLRTRTITSLTVSRRTRIDWSRSGAHNWTVYIS